MKIISWNFGRKYEPWQHLLDMDADLALLQGARKPPSDVAQHIDVDPGPWQTAGADTDLLRTWRTAVVKLSERVQVEWIEAKPLAEAKSEEFAVSQLGTLAAARVTPTSGEPFIVISMYAPGRRPFAKSSWKMVADISAHRLVSDLSAFIGRERNHRLIAAGDLNIYYGYGRSPYWAERYRTVFTRMETLGLPFVGPQAPHGRQAYPWPKKLPPESKNVPTYYHSRHRQTPETAIHQVDYVFASQDFTESMRVRSINEPQEWGPSDHCRIEIEIS